MSRKSIKEYFKTIYERYHRISREVRHLKTAQGR